jgi:hypothetical protein
LYFTFTFMVFILIYMHAAQHRRAREGWLPSERTSYRAARNPYTRATRKASAY